MGMRHLKPSSSAWPCNGQRCAVDKPVRTISGHALYRGTDDILVDQEGKKMGKRNIIYLYQRLVENRGIGMYNLIHPELLLSLISG